jgi:hypothetical protein
MNDEELQEQIRQSRLDFRCETSKHNTKSSWIEFNLPCGNSIRLCKTCYGAICAAEKMKRMK